MKKYLSMAAIGLAALGLVSTAQASLTQSGVNWHAYNASEVSLIDYFTSGVRTLASYTTYVVGSVDYYFKTGGISVYVNGYNPAGTSSPITVYSHSNVGTQLSFQTVTPGAGAYGNWFIGLTQAQAPQFAFVSALVALPPNGGVFYGVTANY